MRFALRVGQLAAVALLVVGCESLPGLHDVANWIGSFGEPDPPEVRSSPSEELAEKMQTRSLNAMVYSNDSQVRSFLETLCMDLGFGVRGPVDLEKQAEVAKDEWFDSLFGDVRDRQELYQGVDIVAAAYTNEPMVTKRHTSRDEKGRVETESTTEQVIEIDVKFLEVGTKILAVHASSTFEKKHSGVETQKDIRDRAEILKSIRDAMVPAMLAKGVGSPEFVARHREAQDPKAREAASKSGD